MRISPPFLFSGVQASLPCLAPLPPPRPLSAPTDKKRTVVRACKLPDLTPCSPLSLSKILSNIKSCEIGGRFLIILITAFLSLLKRARRNRFRSGNYPGGPVPGSRSARSASDRWRAVGRAPPSGGHRTGEASWEEVGEVSPGWAAGSKYTPKSTENQLTFHTFFLSAECFYLVRCSQPQGGIYQCPHF